VSIPVNGIDTYALIDTGSTHTLLSHSVFSKFHRKPLLLDAPRLLSASGDQIPTAGITTVTIANRPQSVVICHGLGMDLLLGADTLKDCVLDLTQKVLKFPDHSLSITLRESSTLPNTTSVVSVVPKAQTPLIQAVLDQYSCVFSPKSTPVAISQLPAAEIVTTQADPIRQQAYRIPHSKRDIVDKCVDEMLNDGIIRPSNSPYASPITLVPKKDGTTRFCVDYRKLNSITRKDAHPLPHIQDVFDSLQGSKVFSTLDLKAGYWQVPMAPESIPLTAFTCFRGLFEFVRLPFGLANAPAIFQRAMNQVLSGLLGKVCMVYIDDIVVYSKTLEDHAQHLKQIFSRLKEVGLQVKPSKCSFELGEIELLGHRVTAEGIKPQPEKVESIANLVPPTDVKAIRSFLGMTGYYRQYIADYASVALPLTELTKKGNPFVWGQEQQAAFDALKQALTRAPILAHADPSKPYVLYTDASDKAVGAILVQNDSEKVERVIAYLSHKLSGAQLRWPTIEKEAFGVVYALKKFHPYLWGATFEIHTDHKPLKSLFSAEIRNSKLQRWAIQISEYSAPIRYHPGKLNIRADMLSRIAAINLDPAPAPAFDLQEIPEIWRADQIDPDELIRAQKDEFEDQWIEATQEQDASPFVIDSGILYSLAEPHRHAGRYPRLMLPHAYRQKVIDRCHIEVAHAAFAKTLARVQESYLWSGMRKSIRSYLGHCTKCRTLTPSNPRILRGTVPVPPCPWHTWGMDLVGPFPRDKRGRQYLLTVIDHLTGWVEAIPIASKKNPIVWDAFNYHVVSRFGVPSVLITDNGTEFTAKSFENWLQTWGIDHKLTSPYHPQTNSKTERFNGTIQKLLLKLTGGQPRRWTDFLSEALYAYRTTVGIHGITPYMATFGMRPRVPRCPTASAPADERLHNLHTASEFLKQHHEASKARYRAQESPSATALSPGTFVSIRVLSPRKGQPKWQPGFQIIGSRGPALRIRNVETSKIYRLNQRDVRVIPEILPYEEIDPLPPKKDRKENDLPETASPLILPDEPTVCSPPTTKAL
jgi:transposase InsO family protein